MNFSIISSTIHRPNGLLNIYDSMHHLSLLIFYTGELYEIYDIVDYHPVRKEMQYKNTLANQLYEGVLACIRLKII